MDAEVAGSCIYALPRGNKTITGPSVRLAEIVASAYGNLHVGSRVLDAGNKEITAQGVAWDIEKNYRVVKEAQRRITDRSGSRYNDDMVIVTGNAAASVAFRNAVFTVIPRAYVDHVMAAARRVAVGDAKGLNEKREKLMERLQKLGVTKEQILVKVGKESVEDIGVTEVELLIGFGTAIKDDPSKLEEFFPTVKAEKSEKSEAKPKAAKSEPKAKEREPDAPSSLEDQLRAQKTREPEPPFGKPPAPNTHRGEPTDGPPPDDDPDQGP
jgi:tellurite resistance protein